MNNPSQSVTWDLLNSVPSTVYERLVIQWPHQTDRDLAFFYSESANRLASTFSGRPIDDTILLPFLMLYRQAFELQLKSFTKYLAAMRRKHREPNNPDLSTEAIAKKLRSRDVGHKLAPLLQELIGHYTALQLSEPFPIEVEKLLVLMHQADEPGTYFRYSGNLPDHQTNVDFPDLVERFKEQFGTLQAVEDWAYDQFQAVPDDWQF
ncbi:hypothetical protein AB4Y67_11335 [Arthrobacter sp. YAF17]|uniref:hypothetical protein n=1 Tax=Arthrobacter sp. YAF17 TaxID=3233077 RepID=UPI003F93DA44